MPSMPLAVRTRAIPILKIRSTLPRSTVDMVAGSMLISYCNTPCAVASCCVSAR